MTLADSNLNDLLRSLPPAKRALLAQSLKEGATLSEDAKTILRWLKRRLKRRVRSKREGKRLL